MDMLKGLINCTLICILFAGVVMLDYSSHLLSGHTNPSGIDKHTALLLIDIQNFYFPNGKVPLENSNPASQKAKKILKFFRKHQLAVIHIKHMPGNKSSLKAGLDTGWSIHPQLAPQSGEKVIAKYHVNCFRDTDLLKFLQNRQIRKLVICGMQTHMCLEAGVRAAADYGFSVDLIHDACATRELVFGDTRIPAHLVHASTLATLKSTYARILSADEFIEEHCAAANPEK